MNKSHCYSNCRLVSSDEVQKQGMAENFPDETKAMNLADLAEKYCKVFPLCFKVVTGFCSLNEKVPTIDIDDLYNAHLVKQTEVVTFWDKAGDQYNVPLYSSAKFGIVYENTKQTFSSVGEIMDAVPVPKVVTVSGFDGKNSKSTLERNEVLVVTEVRKPSFKHGKSWLKVYSVTKSEEQKLLSDCGAKFTTDPYYTKLYITELLQYVPDLFPCRVHLFQDSQCGSVCLPHCLTSEEVLLQDKHVTKSVVVSIVRERGKRKQTDFIDVPTSVGITVTVVNPESNKDVYQKLYSETSTLRKHFDPTKLQPFINAPNDNTYVTRAIKYYAAVHKDYFYAGCKIQASIGLPHQVQTNCNSHHAHADNAKDDEETKTMAEHCKTHDIVLHLQDGCEPACEKAKTKEFVSSTKSDELQNGPKMSSVDHKRTHCAQSDESENQWINADSKGSSSSSEEAIPSGHLKHQESPSRSSSIHEQVKATSDQTNPLFKQGSKCTTYVTDPEGSCPQSPSAELHTTEEQVNLETQGKLTDLPEVNRSKTVKNRKQQNSPSKTSRLNEQAQTSEHIDRKGTPVMSETETENLVDLKVKERTSSDSSKKPTAGVQSQAVHTLPERAKMTTTTSNTIEVDEYTKLQNRLGISSDMSSVVRKRTHYNQVHDKWPMITAYVEQNKGLACSELKDATPNRHFKHQELRRGSRMCAEQVDTSSDQSMSPIKQEPQLRPEGNRKNSEVVQRTVEQSKHRTLSPIVSTSHGHLRSTSAEKKPPETMPKYEPRVELEASGQNSANTKKFQRPKVHSTGDQIDKGKTSESTVNPLVSRNPTFATPSTHLSDQKRSKTSQAGWPLYANHTTNLPCVEVHPKKNGPHKIFVEIDVLEDIPINEAMYANTEKQQQQQYQPLLRTESLHQVYKEVDKIPHNRAMSLQNESSYKRSSMNASGHHYQSLLAPSPRGEYADLGVSSKKKKLGNSKRHLLQYQLPNPNLEKTTDSKLPPQEPLPAVPSGRKTRKQPSTVSECHNGTALCVHTQPRPVVTTPTLIRSPSSQANHLEHPIDIECIQQDKDHSQEQALLTTEQRLPVSVQNTGNVVHQELTCLSVDEVQQLLDALGLQQYKALFYEESIDGEILQELDQNILADELSISIKAHRAKLMKVINGKVSPRTIITGTNTGWV